MPALLHLHPSPLVWSEIYSTIGNLAQLTAFTIQHAAEVTESARAVRAAVTAKEQREILRFMSWDEIMLTMSPAG